MGLCLVLQFGTFGFYHWSALEGLGLALGCVYKSFQYFRRNQIRCQSDTNTGHSLPVSTSLRMSLSLYCVQAFIVLDTEGNRVLAKYYRSKSHPQGEAKEFLTLKDQKAFEKGLWQKTKKAGGDIILYDSHLVVFKHSLDLILYFVAGPTENEVMLHHALVSFADALTMLLRNSLEKRGVLENLDMVLLCLDETIDDGIIVETDAAAIASRVSRPRADTTEIVINEQTIMSAYQTMKEKMQQRIGQLS